MTEIYVQSTPATAQPSATPKFVLLSDVEPREVEWLWQNRIAIGKVNLLAGDPGLGKSYVTLDIASRVSTGAPWPDEPGVHRAVAGVILLSGEDFLDDTVRPRLDLLKADCTRIGAVQSVIVTRGGNRADVERGVDLSKDIESLEAAIDQIDGCKLVVVDPVSVYMGDVNSNDNAEVRGVLSQLSRLAERRNVAVLVVSHLRKGEGPPLTRVIGSVGFVAAPRTAWTIVKDPNNSERRLMLSLKNNIAPNVGGLAYAIPSEGEQAGTVCWEPEPVMLNADDVFVTPQQKRGPAPDLREEAKAWLQAKLDGVALPVNEIMAAADGAGISRATLRRAREELGVTSSKYGSGFWWALPDYVSGWGDVDEQHEQPEQVDGPDDEWE